MSQRKRKAGRSGAAVIPPVPAAGIPGAPNPSKTRAATTQAAGGSTFRTAQAGDAPAPRSAQATAQTATATPQLTRRQTAQFRAAQRRYAAQMRDAKTSAQEQHWIERYSARAELRNAEAREKLIPLGAREQPWALRVSITIAMFLSLGTLALMVFGVRVDHRPPAVSWFLYVVVMFACGVGMWRHWYQAVLAFMCLLGIALVILCALVVRFSNLLGLIIPLVLILAGGTLFWKLVGVLARLQMPERRTRSA